MSGTQDINPKTKEQLADIRQKIAKYSHCLELDHDNIIGYRRDGTLNIVYKNERKHDWLDDLYRTSKCRDVVKFIKYHTNALYITKDGSVMWIIEPKNYSVNYDIECKVASWKGIKDIQAHDYQVAFIIGLKNDGTVESAGTNDHGQCNTNSWRDIIQIAIGKGTWSDYKAEKYTPVEYGHTIGLKKDGTVVATGANFYGQCNVENWKSVIFIATNERHTVGLRADGTVVATGETYSGACDVEDWSDIVSIKITQDSTLGLKSDGTMLVCGRLSGRPSKYMMEQDSTYQPYERYIEKGEFITSCRDVVAFDIEQMCSSQIICLQSNGTVITSASIDHKEDIQNYQTNDWKDIVAVFAGAYRLIGLKSDGTVATAWPPDPDLDACKNWKDIGPIDDDLSKQKDQADKDTYKQKKTLLKEILKENAKYQGCISTSFCGDGRNIVYIHAVGLRKDGTVVAVGNNEVGQCNTQNWEGVIRIANSGMQTFGLKYDGTVLSIGNNQRGQCNVTGWKDIIAISAGVEHTVGLKKDGTVLAVGSNDCGQCNTQSWKGIVAVSAGGLHTVGLQADGRVVSAGMNMNGQCDTGKWDDVVAISAGMIHTVGLRADGKILVTGTSTGEFVDPLWNDMIIDIVGGATFTVGLKQNGTILVEEHKKVYEFNDGKWQDIVALAAYQQILGLKKDGSVVAYGQNKQGEMAAEKWTNIGQPPDQQIWKWQGLCQQCGGEIGGFIFKKCKSCGKK